MMKKCPYCCHEINNKAIRCINCRQMVPPGPEPDSTTDQGVCPFCGNTLKINGRRCMKCGQLVSDSYKLKELDSLFVALESSDPPIRCSAATILGDLRAVRSVDPLIKALNNADSNFQCVIIEALGNIRDPRAINPILNLLNQERDSELSRVICETIIKIGDIRVTEPLSELLRNPYSKNKVLAIRILSRFNYPKSVDPLCSALIDEDLKVKKEAIKSLGDIGDKRAVKPLIEILDNEDPAVRSEAIKALGIIGDISAIEYLCDEKNNEKNEKLCDLYKTSIEKLTKIAKSKPLDFYGFDPDNIMSDFCSIYHSEYWYFTFYDYLRLLQTLDYYVSGLERFEMWMYHAFITLFIRGDASISDKAAEYFWIGASESSIHHMMNILLDRGMWRSSVCYPDRSRCIEKLKKACPDDRKKLLNKELGVDT
jgi:HEAT repeat protein